MKRSTDCRDDSGSSLVVVLIVVTVVALGLAALLSLTDTSIRTTMELRDRAATTYTGDGSIQAAINAIRNDDYNATGTEQCFGTTDTLVLPNFQGTQSAAVRCTPDPARVLIQCPSLSQCNRPGSAILTTGTTPGEDGINIQQPSGSTFRVRGNVFSNSTINVANGAFNTNTPVYARGACSGTIQATKNCNYGSTANALGDDPGYAAEIATAPAYRTMPACTSPGSLVTFTPGYYDDAKALSDMMAGNSACRGSTWWFKPGAYYFDFHNSGAGLNPTLSSAANVWTVNDGTLVAGTPINAAGTVIAAPPVPATVPHACDNPIDHATAKGVQFIFGGDSQLAVKSGQVEICGTYHVNTPPVAIYGLRTGAETTTALTGATTLKLSGTQVAADFANPANAATTDGSAATWLANGANSNNAKTGVLRLSGFAPPSAVPAGSNLGTVANATSIVVVHGNSNGANNDVQAITITPTDATGVASTSPIVVPVPSHNDNLVHTDRIDVAGNLAAFVHARGFSGATIAYSATVKHNGTESVDAIQLDLTYTPPAFRAGSGCITAGPYSRPSGAASCALVLSDNGAGGGNAFYVQGTTYAPRAVLDITLSTASEQIFRFGVVARSLWVKETGSFSYTGVVIGVPEDSPGFVFSVYLSACLGTPTCTPAESMLRAKVAFVDLDPATPVPGQRQVVVLSWSAPG